jgi:hypothetical protein
MLTFLSCHLPAGVLFCMPILFSLEAALVSARVQCFTGVTPAESRSTAGLLRGEALGAHTKLACAPNSRATMIVPRAEAIGKFPNLDSAIEEHIEIWKCIDRFAAETQTLTHPR